GRRPPGVAPDEQVHGSPSALPVGGDAAPAARGGHSPEHALRLGGSGGGAPAPYLPGHAGAADAPHLPAGGRDSDPLSGSRPPRQQPPGISVGLHGSRKGGA